MTPANLHEAKTQFSKLIEAVANGEEVLIAKAGKPTARQFILRPRGKRLLRGPVHRRKPKLQNKPVKNCYHRGLRGAGAPTTLKMTHGR